MLTQKQKIAIRRHLGVPFAGTAEAGRLIGWRFADHIEDLEYKMNNLQAPEEQLLTGASMGSWRIDGSPTVGDVLSFIVTPAVGGASTVAYTVTSADLAATMPSGSIAINAARAITAALQHLGYSAVGVNPADSFSTAYLPPYFGEVILAGPSAGLFTLTASVVGTTNLYPADPGSQCPITQTFLTVDNSTVVLFGMIAVLDFLAMSTAQADQNLSYSSADVVAFRPDEVRARKGLYRSFQMDMAKLIGAEKYVRKFFGAGRGSVA